jgi:dethiobiotin synthetase
MSQSSSNNGTFFVTGTDTGVGKTLVTAALLQAARNRGESAFALKPLAAGCEQTPEGLRNDDALLLQRYNTVEMSYQQINPVALAAAKAPHIAAFEEGRKLSLQRLEGFCRGALMQRADWRFIEGAGGWRVPLNEGESLSGLPALLNIPVILVVGMRLGCLNHALLTAEAIRRDGLRLAGWVANSCEPTMPSLAENIATLTALIPARCLGVIPHMEDSSVLEAATCLDLEILR